MTSRFPSVHSLSEYEPFSRDEALLRPGVNAICDVLGLARASLCRYPDGSLPVYAVGDSLALKIYPPFDLAARDAESTILQVVDDRLSVPTPGVRAVGELDGWGYLLMDQLRGVSLAEAWPHVPADDQLRIAAAMGEALAELHSVSDVRLDAVRVDWPHFIEEQRSTAVAAQRRGWNRAGSVDSRLSRTRLSALSEPNRFSTRRSCASTCSWSVPAAAGDSPVCSTSSRPWWAPPSTS
jgi:hygromycin-B 7''-O-kinase